MSSRNHHETFDLLPSPKHSCLLYVFFTMTMSLGLKSEKSKQSASNETKVTDSANRHPVISQPDQDPGGGYMPAITKGTTVGEVASAFPASIPFFEKNGIDFCCGGNRPIGEICQEKGLPFHDFLATVENAQHSRPEQAASDWLSAPLGQLIDYILIRHHSFLKSELPRLSGMLHKVVDVHGANHGDSLIPLSKVFGLLRAELEDHMWKEENMLFPLIRRMEDALAGISGEPRRLCVSDMIRVMELEHQSAGNALERIRRLTDEHQTPADGCATYRAVMEGLKALETDLHQHIHLENNILFPRAIDLEF